MLVAPVLSSVHLDLAMKFLALAIIVASASAKNLRFNLLAPPTELEYGFCGEIQQT